MGLNLNDTHKVNLHTPIIGADADIHQYKFDVYHVSNMKSAMVSLTVGGFNPKHALARVANSFDSKFHRVYFQGVVG